MRRMIGILGVGGWVLLAAGCDPETCKVTGTVTFDGRPVPDGGIIFHDVQGLHGPEYAPIKDGRFSLKARPGDKRVEIRAAREVPEKRTPMGPCYEDYIPARYNGPQSELTARLVPGANQLDFPLKSR